MDQLEQKSKIMAVHCLSFGIRKLERLVTRHYDSYVSPTGVSAIQLPLVASMHLNPGRTLREQADVLQIDRTTLWRNLRPLIHAGFVLEDSEARPRRYHLSPRGVAALENAVNAWTEADQALRQALGKRPSETLEETIRTARRALRSGS